MNLCAVSWTISFVFIWKCFKNHNHAKFACLLRSPLFTLFLSLHFKRKSKKFEGGGCECVTEIVGYISTFHALTHSHTRMYEYFCWKLFGLKLAYETHYSIHIIRIRVDCGSVVNAKIYLSVNRHTQKYIYIIQMHEMYSRVDLVWNI